jgi:hypothetical protein
VTVATGAFLDESPRAPVVAAAGDEGLRIQRIRHSKVAIRCIDAATGEPVDGAIRFIITEPRSGRSTTAIGGGRILQILPPGRARLDIEAEGYLPVRAFAVDVPEDGSSVDVALELTPDAGARGWVELVVTDEAAGPVTALLWRRFLDERREESASGRYTLRLVAGTHDLELETPRERVQRLEPSWLRQTVSVKLERGGRVVEHVRMKRGGILYVRWEPKDAFTEFGILREGEARDFRSNPRADGFVTLLEPGRYEVTGVRDGRVHRTSVEVKPHEVAEAWFRAGD